MKHFDISEFDSPDAPGSGFEMKQEFLDRLDKARSLSCTPYKINSGYRTREHNKKVGGVINSSHTIGLAADISAGSSVQRFAILKGLIDAGFTRIGIGKTFIHVDLDTGKAQNVIWDY